MTQRYFLYLFTTALFLLLIFLAFSSWKFLLSSVERTRAVTPAVLELPEVAIERYNKLVKKGL